MRLKVAAVAMHCCSASALLLCSIWSQLCLHLPTPLPPTCKRCSFCDAFASRTSLYLAPALFSFCIALPPWFSLALFLPSLIPTYLHALLLLQSLCFK